MNKVVYLPIEVKKREFTAKCLLATVLANRGFVVLVAGRFDCRRLAAEGAPGILIDKDFTERRASEWKRIKDNGSAVFAWDEEGIVEVIEHIIRLRTGKSAIEMSDGIFLWGECQKRILESDNLNSEKLYVIGNPRIDLLRKEAYVFYRKGSEKLINRYGKFILINLNFCKDDGMGLTADIVAVENNGVISDEDRERLNQTGVKYQELVNLYRQMIEGLAREVDNTVIVRPHPGERAMDWWHDSFQAYENVVITREGDANMWIRAAAIMIHPGCTTSMEAYISRNPSIYYNPIEELKVPFLSELSMAVTSEKELIDLTKKYLAGLIPNDVFFTDDKNKLINEHIYIDEKKTSCEMIADIFETIKYDENESVEIKLDNGLKTVYRRIKGFWKRKESLNGKFGYTNTSEVAACVDSSRHMMNYDGKIKVKKIGNNAFTIRKEAK